jgi:hypothetical protein
MSASSPSSPSTFKRPTLPTAASSASLRTLGLEAQLSALLRDAKRRGDAALVGLLALDLGEPGVPTVRVARDAKGHFALADTRPHAALGSAASALLPPLISVRNKKNIFFFFLFFFFFLNSLFDSRMCCGTLARPRSLCVARCRASCRSPHASTC